MAKSVFSRVGSTPPGSGPARFLTACLLVILLGGCATFGRVPPGPPLSDREVEETVARIRQESGKATSFYTRGSLLVKDWYWEEETSMVMVGSSEPFRVKIEVTHGWGQPILHILVDRGKLEVLSFTEGRLYVGAFTPEALSRFIPGPMTPELIWAVLRGYPVILPYTRSHSPQAARIDLYGPGGERVETLEFDQGGMHPSRVHLPVQRAQLTFSSYEEVEGIVYAREVGVDQKGSRGKLTLRREKAVFNRTAPNEVFTVDKPPTFTVVQLEQERGPRFEERGSRE